MQEQSARHKVGAAWSQGLRVPGGQLAEGVLVDQTRSPLM